MYKETVVRNESCRFNGSSYDLAVWNNSGKPRNVLRDDDDSRNR